MTTLSFYKLQILSFSILLIHSVSLGYAQEKLTPKAKQLYFLGGGGDPDGTTTIFDRSISQVSKFTQSAGSEWSIKHSFNGGHSETEKLLKAQMPSDSSLGNFTEENLNKTLADLETKLNSGELKSGDQLLLMLNSHGAMKLKKEKSHSIALSSSAAVDLKTLEGTELFPMDRFEKILTLASEKGIKVGLVDLSCFSGNSLKISNKNICVISASGENQYSYVDQNNASTSAGIYNAFGARFLDGLKTGQNLEDIFLKARAGSFNPDFPMISTDTGSIVNNLIYKLISPYLMYNYKSTTDFSESYDPLDLSKSFCKTQTQFDEVQKRMDEIKNLSSIPGNLLDTTNLKKALTAYRDYQVYYEKAYKDWSAKEEEVKNIIAKDYPDQVELFEKENGGAILESNYLAMMKKFEDLIKKEDIPEDKRNYYRRTLAGLVVKDKIVKELNVKISADSKAKLAKFREIYMKSGKIKDFSDEVSAEAKKLYDVLYRANSKGNKIKNPCKDFVL
jgi:hypothetical protein